MICVECGENIAQTYKEYSKGNIRLVICEACKKVADKYVEYEATLLFVDIALHKIAAFRHLLFNRRPDIPNVTLLYIWLSLLAMDVYKDYLIDDELGSKPTYSMDNTSLSFWLQKTAVAAISSIFYVLMAIGLNSALMKTQAPSPKLIVTALLVSSWCKYLILLAVIWEYHWTQIIILEVLTLASNQASMRATRKNIPQAVLVFLLLAFTIQLGARHWTLVTSAFGN